MQKRIWTTLGVLALAVMMVLPGTLLAVEHNHGSAEITKQLNDFKIQAVEARRHAAELESYNRSNVSWQTHATKLEAVKAEINDMGRILAELEDLKSEANSTQFAAIEAIRPTLEGAAEDLSKAIAMLNEDTRIVKMPEYRETLRNVWEQAAALYDHSDAVLDYHDASSRYQRISGAM